MSEVVSKEVQGSDLGDAMYSDEHGCVMTVESKVLGVI